jgi:hypothetical protein
VLGDFVNDADDDATVPNYLVHRGRLVIVVSRELIERDLVPVADRAAALARIRAALAEEFGP